MPGATVKDVPAHEFIVALAQHFKKSQKVELPEWHDVVKTAPYKELCPQDADWFFVRAASVARKVYLRNGVGLGALSKVYGGKKSNGARRPHFALAAEGIQRNIFHQLEKLELVGQKKGLKGRFITSKGRRELDTIAAQLIKSKK